MLIVEWLFRQGCLLYGLYILGMLIPIADHSTSQAKEDSPAEKSGPLRNVLRGVGSSKKYPSEDHGGFLVNGFMLHRDKDEYRRTTKCRILTEAMSSFGKSRYSCDVTIAVTSSRNV
jgi:hypothetical protein